MTTANYLPGRSLVLRGHRMTVGMSDLGHAVLYPSRGGTPTRVSIAQLESHRHAGHLVLDPLPSVATDRENPVDLESLGDTVRPLVARRLAYVRPFIAARSQYIGGLPKREAVELIRQTAMERKETMPHYASVARWVKSFTTSDGRIDAMVPRFSDRGNRKPRLPEDARLAIARAVQGWLSTERPTMKNAHGHLVTEILNLNSARLPEHRLAIPSQETLSRAIRSTDPYVSACARLGKRSGRRSLRTRAGGPQPTMLLERVEIDHSPLDLICIDERGAVIGRPSLTIAIDKATRCPVGVCISYVPPSTITVLECIKDSLKPKDYIATRFPDIKSTWPAFGKALVYVTDNGKEFHGNSFQALKESLGVSISYMPRRHPWFKGAVERFFGTQNRALTHNLPGTTKSNVRERGEYVSTEKACLTKEQFEGLFLKWLIDIYLNEVHSALGCTPRTAWEKLAEVSPPQSVPADSNLDMSLALVEERRINNGRIRYEGLDYWSPVLSLVEKSLKPGETVRFRVNTSDLGAIYVAHPQTQTYFSAECTQPRYATGLSLHLHNALKAMSRAPSRTGLDVEQLAQRKAELKQATAAAVASGKRTTRRRAKRLLDDVTAHEARIGPIPLPVPRGEAASYVMPPPIAASASDDEFEVVRQPTGGETK